MRYAYRDDATLWGMLPEATASNPDWPVFVSNVLLYYPGCEDERPYQPPPTHRDTIETQSDTTDIRTVEYMTIRSHSDPVSHSSDSSYDVVYTDPSMTPPIAEPCAPQYIVHDQAPSNISYNDIDANLPFSNPVDVSEGLCPAWTDPDNIYTSEYPDINAPILSYEIPDTLSLPFSYYDLSDEEVDTNLLPNELTDESEDPYPTQTSEDDIHEPEYMHDIVIVASPTDTVALPADSADPFYEEIDDILALYYELDESEDPCSVWTKQDCIYDEEIPDIFIPILPAIPFTVSRTDIASVPKAADDDPESVDPDDKDLDESEVPCPAWTTEDCIFDEDIPDIFVPVLTPVPFAVLHADITSVPNPVDNDPESVNPDNADPVRSDTDVPSTPHIIHTRDAHTDTHSSISSPPTSPSSHPHDASPLYPSTHGLNKVTFLESVRAISDILPILIACIARTSLYRQLRTLRLFIFIICSSFEPALTHTRQYPFDPGI
ncbi:hypothetical protein L210DRAFT_3650145 [Boletus edulis BED1]|uniref:Uncharacterized protein n=1 Tax=Boletus edulis BED1 TaxID=1328754 RepID=A0AAD4BJE4_BOLED|nr:hypothetical protein L210DRAFT_3650145 [Boletus edulis BED1]